MVTIERCGKAMKSHGLWLEHSLSRVDVHGCSTIPHQFTLGKMITTSGGNGGTIAILICYHMLPLDAAKKTFGVFIKFICTEKLYRCRPTVRKSNHHFYVSYHLYPLTYLIQNALHTFHVLHLIDFNFYLYIYIFIHPFIKFGYLLIFIFFSIEFYIYST